MPGALKQDYLQPFKARRQLFQDSLISFGSLYIENVPRIVFNNFCAFVRALDEIHSYHHHAALSDILPTYNSYSGGPGWSGDLPRRSSL